MLAPFNSTITNEDFHQYLCEEIPIEDAGIIKFSDKVREANRQYEFNYNDEVDNGIMISMSNEEDKKSQTKITDEKAADKEEKNNVAKK